jgi:hypothetical protein
MRLVRWLMRSIWLMAFPALLGMSMIACGGSNGNTPSDGTSFAAMAGAFADCEYDVLTFTRAEGPSQEVHINGLPVEALPGANKVSASSWEVVRRRGVRFSTILTHVGISVGDDTPVNGIGRDGYDTLREKLQNDTSELPHFDFIRDHGYVYVGSPGDKDPLYPEMEGRTLMVDYDMDGDSDVPDYLGGTITSLSIVRWKMMEKFDDTHYGTIEIDPVP